MPPEHLHGLFLAWTILAAGLFGPGPNNLALAQVSTTQGRPEGVQMALGLALGGMIWLTAGVLGLAALLSASSAGTSVLRVAAATYLLWLAFRSFRFALNPPPPSVIGASLPRHRMVMRGATLSLTNPKSAMMWLSVAALGLGHDPPPAVAVTLIAGAAVLALGGHLTYALAFSSAPVSTVYGRWQRWIQGLFGLFLCYAGIQILLARG